jgi:asparagine synthase (glutamine-hydrolysing)
MRIKLKGFQRKAVLRNTIAKRLPAELLVAPKRGFSMPLYEWLQAGAIDRVEQHALRAAASGLLCRDTIKCILMAHKSGNRDAAQAIWTLSMLAGHVS